MLDGSASADVCREQRRRHDRDVIVAGVRAVDHGQLASADVVGMADGAALGNRHLRFLGLDCRSTAR